MGLYVWMRNLASCVLYKHISKDNMSRERERESEREKRDGDLALCVDELLNMHQKIAKEFMS